MDRTISKQTDRLDSAEVTHDTVTVGILAGGVKWLEVEMEAGNGGHWCEMRRGDRPRVRCCGPVNTPATLTLGAIRADPVTRETICTGQRAPEARRSEWWQICGLVEGRPGGSERGAARAASAGCADGGLATVGGGSV
jgi:hypothetical protein